MFLKKFQQDGRRKITAVITATSFMLSIFASGGYAAPSQVPMPAQPLNVVSAAPVDYIVPFNIGRVTDALNTGNGKVIVNIQDLHAHEETQRNINSILAMLDAKYGISKIYVEGAVGQLNTGWLANIEDEVFKEAAINTLMKDGKLTGAEYYSIKSSKTNILHGIENRKLYIDNLLRLDEIYKKREEIQKITPEIKLLLKSISERYYSKENLSFLKSVNKYKEGKTGSDKYFKYLIETAGKSDVNFANYPSIVSFAQIIRLQSSLSNKRIAVQMTELVDSLKEEMPYSEYKKIADLFGKPEEEGNLYLALAGVYDKYGFAGKYKELGRFFEMAKLNQNINPVDLVLEERQLTKEVMYRLAKMNAEVEVIFLNDMFATFDSYLNNKVSAKEYEFFEKSLPEFKVLWEKYVDTEGLPELSRYYDLFDQFYKVNIERNRYFLEQITGVLPGQTKDKVRLITSSEQKSASKLLANSKNIDVVITGGFHTHDLAKLMGDNGYSYIVITPNVTQNTILSDKNYDANILKQAGVLQNTFKEMLESSMINFAESNPIPYIASYITSFQILQTAEQEGVSDNFSTIFAQMISAHSKELKDKFNINDLSVLSPVKDGENYKVTFVYTDAQGRTQTSEQIISKDAPSLNYSVTEQRRFNFVAAAAGVVISAAIGLFLAPVSIPVALAVSAAVGASGLFFNIAGLANAKIISRAMEDFGNYASNLGSSYAAPETKIDLIADSALPNAMTQEEFLKNFEDRLKEKTALAPEVTIKSMFDASAPADVSSRSLSVIATVSKNDPNTIYVNPVALFFLDKRSGALAEALISNHEQLHTIAGGSKSELRTSIESTYNFKFARQAFGALKKERNSNAAKAKFRELIAGINAFERTMDAVTIDDIKSGKTDYSMSIKEFLEKSSELLKLLDSEPYLNVDEMERVSSAVRSIAHVIDLIGIGTLNKINNPYDPVVSPERYGIFRHMNLISDNMMKNINKDIKLKYPDFYTEVSVPMEAVDTPAVREIMRAASEYPEIAALYSSIEEFDKSRGTLDDVKRLQDAMSKIEINLTDQKTLNAAKVEALAEALKRLKYTAGGKEYSYTEANALVFKLQTLIGFGIVNPQGIEDPIVLADTFMPISQSQEYVEQAAKQVVSFDELKKYAKARTPASMVYLWLNGGLGENVLARHPIIYALRTFSKAMEDARAAGDTVAIQRLSEIARGNDLFGRGLADGEEIRGFSKINPDDFYESENGRIKVDAKGKPVVKESVIINGTKVDVPALTGKATDTPFVVRGEDGIYEFRSIMDIKVNELKGHSNATGTQIVGPGSEPVAQPLTEIEGVRNEEILKRVLGEDATSGLIIQERYYPWAKEEKADGSAVYKMNFGEMNPGGHGTIAFDLVLRLADSYRRYMAGNNLTLADMTPEQIEKAKQELGDVVFANGDGVNSGPKGRMGAVTLYGVPRQTVDAKGGIFGFIKDRVGRLFLYLSELGNTPEALKKQFQKYGLEDPYNTPQGFNTNTQQIGVFETGALFAELINVIGTENVFKLMASPTITAADYKKFEWAIGQIMLWANANLQILRRSGTAQGERVNDLMNKILGENKEFVTLVISDDSQREEIGFTPYKFVTDIIKYMYGGNVVDGAWVPYNSHGLDVNVEGDASKYLYNMYNNWIYLSTENLTNLNVNGDFILNNLNLSGEMTFINNSGKAVELSDATPALSGLKRDADGKPVLENMIVTVDENGEISIVTKEGVTVWSAASEALEQAVGFASDAKKLPAAIAGAVVSSGEREARADQDITILKLQEAVDAFDSGAQSMEDIAALRQAMADVRLNLESSQELNRAKVEALSEALKRLRYTAGGREYRYSDENALVFKLQTLIGFGIDNPEGIADPIVLADTFMPISESQFYVDKAKKIVMSFDDLQGYSADKDPASMVYLWLNGGLGENVLARHPIIYAMKKFGDAMNAAIKENDVAAVQRLSDIAKGNDLFGQSLAGGENIYGFTKINPGDFYESRDGNVVLDGKGRPVVKDTVLINGEEVKVPALTGKATDTPFIIESKKIVDGKEITAYEFRSIMDIKVNELKGHANATGVQIVGPGGETVALPLTEIEGVRNEEILGRVLGDDSKSGLIIQERYYPWKEYTNDDGSKSYGMDFGEMNPGGHGTIAYSLVSRLMDSYNRYMNGRNLADMTPSEIEQAKRDLGDVVFANGDGVNSGPKGRKGAVTMYGVPRQTVDAKGGIFGFIKDRLGRLFVYLSELGNTPKDLKDRFQKYGLEEPFDSPQGFNTNTQQIGVFEVGALFSGLTDMLGQEAVFRMMASPTITADNNRKFEWAIGQIMLWVNANLEILRSEDSPRGFAVNELMNKILGESEEFVTLVVSDDRQREEIGFTPYKFVTDIIKYMYGGSVIDGQWVPYNDKGLNVNVDGNAEKFLYYMYHNWTYLETADLTDLNVNGDFKLNNLRLEGAVTFINKSGRTADISSETLGSLNLPADENGRVILKDITVTVDKAGNIFVADSSSKSVRTVLSDFFNNYVQKLKIALRNLFIGKSYVEIKAPELKNKSYTFVTAEYTPDIMRQARALASKGINVNIIMPYGGHTAALPEGVSTIRQDMDYVYSDGKRAAVQKYSETDADTGKSINFYMYNQMEYAAEEVTKDGLKTDMRYAFRTLQWLKDQALYSGKYDFGIIDIQRNTGISFEMAQNMFPDAVIASSISNRVDPLFEIAAQGEAGFAVYFAGSEERFLGDAGEMLRNRDKNSYMQTSPIFSTTIDMTKMPLSDFNTDAAIKELKTYGFDTMVIKLDRTNTVSDIDTLKSILIRAHQQDVRVVMEYAFSDYSSFENWLRTLDSQLASFRASTGIVSGAKEFIDGIRLDLSQMSEADAAKAAESFKAVRGIINRESSEAVFGVKSPHYDAALYREAKIRPVRTISHESKDALTAVENAWVEFSVGSASYDEQSMNYDITAQDIEKVITAKTTDIVGIDYYVVKALKKAEDSTFSTLNMLRNVFMQRAAAFRNTPEGSFNSARAMAVRQNALAPAGSAETALYKGLADLRAGRNVDSAVENIAANMQDNQFIADLAVQYNYNKNANAEKAAITAKTIEGYLQGVFENTEMSDYEKKSGREINYVVKTNKDMLAKALVQAKLMLAMQDIRPDMVIGNAKTDTPYAKDLNSRNAEESLRILQNENNAELQKVLELINSLDRVSAAEAFEIIQEAINILDSLIETDSLSSDAKPVALSELIAMLALKADIMPGKITDTASKGLQNIAANTRAVLAAA